MALVTPAPCGVTFLRPGYTEAGPWQYRVEVPYDPKALQAKFKE